MVALTFDAGASSKPTSQLLDRLKAAGLKVTFFLTGRWCEQNEALVRRIHDEGHEIANHTYSHPDLRKLEDSAIREEITRTDEIVLRITGDHCAPYLRPPYGARDRRVLRIASEEGYTLIYWSVDSWDAFKKGIMADEIRERVLDRVRGGDIVLMHCGSQATADALPELIRELHTRGLKIVTVTELLRAG
ncbi:MAG: polysaccharide deacetylase family protein [Armatimonadota bacterium]